MEVRGGVIDLEIFTSQADYIILDEEIHKDCGREINF